MLLLDIIIGIRVMITLLDINISYGNCLSSYWILLLLAAPLSLNASSFAQ